MNEVERLFLKKENEYSMIPKFRLIHHLKLRINFLFVICNQKKKKNYSKKDLKVAFFISYIPNEQPNR